MEKVFQIEKCTMADVPFIKRLMDETLAAMEQKEWYITDDIEFLEAHVEKEGFILKAVDTEQNELAAFLVVRIPGEAEDNLGTSLNLNKEERMRVAHMESAAVGKDWRGFRLQRRLLAEAEQIVSGMGIEWIMATVHPDNCRSRNNLLAQGFEVIATVEKYGGTIRDIVCMHCKKGLA